MAVSHYYYYYFNIVTFPIHSAFRFYQIYSGTNHSFKVGKLEENSTYRLRICASNEAGLGPFSEPVEFTTTKAPPPPIKGNEKKYVISH